MHLFTNSLLLDIAFFFQIQEQKNNTLKIYMIKLQKKSLLIPD